MKEPYKDDQFYDERQEFGPVAFRNFDEVVRQYTYELYVARFRARADQYELQPSQRPKLSETEFNLLKKQLEDAMRRGGGGALLDNEKSAEVVARLLLADLLEEEDLP